MQKNFVKYTSLLAVFLVLMTACTRGTPGGRDWRDWHMMDYMMGGGWFMWIFLLIIIGVVVYMLMNMNKTKYRDREGSETPLDILKRRYANGDITQEEYEEKKRNLGY